MENKELNALRNTKPHQDKNLLADLVEKLISTKDIANYLNISTKLVSIKLKEFGLRIDS